MFQTVRNSSLVLFEKKNFFSVLANVQMSSGVKSTSIEDDLTGFIIALNTNGRIVLISDNVEYYLRKNVVSISSKLKKTRK